MRESTKFVLDSIADSLVKLLTEKTFDEISICEITQAAQVSRNSFYRHFTDKEDILRFYISRETEKWLSETKENYLTLIDKGIREYIVFLLEHMFQYRNFVDILIRNRKMHLLESEFDKRFLNILSEVSNPWRIAFTTGGFYKLFCYWAETGYKKTPREIAEYIDLQPER